jgi:hypothetical protein
MKSTISWDMTPCSPLSVNRRLGGTYRLHLQGSSEMSVDTHGVISQKMIFFKYNLNLRILNLKLKMFQCHIFICKLLDIVSSVALHNISFQHFPRHVLRTLQSALRRDRKQTTMHKQKQTSSVMYMFKHLSNSPGKNSACLIGECCL